MDAVAEFLAHVPDEFVVVDESDLRGRVTAVGGADGDRSNATAADSTDSAAPTPTERAEALLVGGPETAPPERLELVTPVVPRVLVDALRTAVLEAGTPLDVVATGDATAALDDGPIEAALSLLRARDDVAVSVHGGDAPFAVLVRPDVVGFAMPGEDGRVERVFESDCEAARVWARSVVDVFQREAERVV